MGLLKKISTKINLPIIAIVGISVATGSFLYFSDSINIRGAADGKGISTQINANGLATWSPPKTISATANVPTVNVPRPNVPQMNIELPDQTNPCDAAIRVRDDQNTTNDQNNRESLDVTISGCIENFIIKTIDTLYNSDRPSCTISFKQFNGALIAISLDSQYCIMISQARLMNAIAKFEVELNATEFESINTPKGEYLINNNPYAIRVEQRQVKFISY